MSPPGTNSTARMLPSDEWTLVPLHWHAYSQPAHADTLPEAALHHPSAVATWLAERSGAHLWRSHFLIASRGDSIRHDHFVVRTVLNQNCAHACVGAYLASGRRL
jgi:hypothetical protein